MKKQEVIKLMTILSLEYENFQVSEERVALWEGILKHATGEEGMVACKALLSEARAFPPRVGEINSHIIETRQAANRRRRIEAEMLKQNREIEHLPPPQAEVKERCLTLVRDCLQSLENKRAANK